MFCETKADFSAQHPFPRTSVPRSSSGWLAVMASSPLHNISAKVHSLQLSLASVCVCVCMIMMVSEYFQHGRCATGGILHNRVLRRWVEFPATGAKFALVLLYALSCRLHFPVLLLPGGAFFGTFSATMTLESRVVKRSKLGEKEMREGCWNEGKIESDWSIIVNKQWIYQISMDGGRTVLVEVHSCKNNKQRFFFNKIANCYWLFKKYLKVKRVEAYITSCKKMIFFSPSRNLNF